MRQIGDVVTIRHDLAENNAGPGVAKTMLQYRGQEATIVGHSTSIWGGYTLNIDDGLFTWTDQMFESESESGLVIKIKRVRDYATIPQYQTAGASGFDLVVVQYDHIQPGQSKWIPLGLAFEIPKGYEMQIRPRSGLSQMWPAYISNSPGTIDSDYRGEVQLGISNNTHYTMYLNPGDRIAQGVICPVVQAKLVEVNELSETKRGAGGFGSTGK